MIIFFASFFCFWCAKPFLYVYFFPGVLTFLRHKEFILMVQVFFLVYSNVYRLQKFFCAGPKVVVVRTYVCFLENLRVFRGGKSRFTSLTSFLRIRFLGAFAGTVQNGKCKQCLIAMFFVKNAVWLARFAQQPTTTKQTEEKKQQNTNENCVEEEEWGKKVRCFWKER